jgi:hypothetical protein
VFTVPSADGRFDEEIIIAKLIVPAERGDVGRYGDHDRSRGRDLEIQAAN